MEDKKEDRGEALEMIGQFRHVQKGLNKPRREPLWLRLETQYGRHGNNEAREGSVTGNKLIAKFLSEAFNFRLTS